MSLRLKLILAFTVLCATALLLALLATPLAVRGAAQAKMATDLQRTVGRFQNELAELERELALSVDATFADSELFRWYGGATDQNASLGLGDSGEEDEGLRQAHRFIHSADLRFVKGDARNEVVMFINGSGRLIYSRAAPERFGDDLRGVPLVDSALEGQTGSGLWSIAQLRKHETDGVDGKRDEPLPILLGGDTDDLLAMFSKPIERAGQRVGAVLIGRRVKRDLLPQLAGAADAVIALRALDGTVASTLAGAEEAVAKVTDDEPRVLEIGGKRYLAQGSELAPAGGDAGRILGRAVLLKEVDAEVEPILTGFIKEVPKIALATLALSMLAAFFLARRMTRPIVALEEAARRVKLGDLTVEVPETTHDEVGRLAGSFNEMVRGLRQRDQIKGLFKRYLDPQVVDELIRSPEKAAPGGERRVITVLFCDLVGFSTFSEKLSPEALVALLNEYFEEVTQVLASHRATFDKFIGDAVMCFWNAPLAQTDHAQRACLAALDLIAVVERLAPRFEAAVGAKLDCRIGINTGPCIVGNIGSRAAQDYTVIGDAVNLASRLEGAAKNYGIRTLVSSDTLEAAGPVVLTREVDIVKVKGRVTPVRVFELIGRSDAAPPPRIQTFSQGLALYRERRYAEALDVFSANEGDPPSQVFAQRCSKRLASDTLATDDEPSAVHVLETK